MWIEPSPYPKSDSIKDGILIRINRLVKYAILLVVHGGNSYLKPTCRRR